MKLFNRYNRISLPIIMGIFLISGLCCYLWVNHILISDFDESLTEHAQKITDYINKNGEFPKAVVTDDWMVSYKKIDHATPSYFETKELYDQEDKDFVQYRSLSYVFTLKGQHYLIIVSKSLEALSGLSRSIALITTITILVVILVSLVLSHFLLRRLWRPFYTTLDLLREFKLGTPRQLAFENTSTEEFAFMNRQLSEMMRNADKEYLVLKEFTENASHEIQTPLSIIRSKLDIIMQGENLTELQINSIASAFQSVRRLTNLGQSLLLLSKIENNQFIKTEYLDLKERISDKLTQLEEFWGEKQITIDAVLEPASINANADLIDILLNNLFNNAHRHNVDGGLIRVNLQQGVLTIANTGDKKPIDPDKIFTRFYKAEQSSSNNGLGLSIIKQICDQSGIDIKYELSWQMHLFTFEW
ncbi:sensor histidine kinase [Mucilaginibacter agri]|uniref:histidine kinase n=1 Tax=Mucilaginibacter agri TaxID=2695265 RepID=A0A966DV57_9SPHI|nr:HAMP domain-containing sensor histidine kinase [Mucilaginibacter agri]NCD71141.1 hypothetical protein [Mucilaginibacter agri]